MVFYYGPVDFLFFINYDVKVITPWFYQILNLKH